MKKTKQTKQTKPTDGVVVAETCKALYDAFLMQGFTTDQAFQLLLAVIDKQTE